MHSHRAVEAPSVVPVDPASGRELDVRERSGRAGVEDGGADALGLKSLRQSRGRCHQAVDALHEGVVVGVADGPDRRGDALEVEVLDVPDRGVLGEFNRLMQHRAVGASVAVR